MIKGLTETSKLNIETYFEDRLNGKFKREIQQKNQKESFRNIFERSYYKNELEGNNKE